MAPWAQPLTEYGPAWAGLTRSVTTCGNGVTKKSDELRSSLAGSSDRSALSNRLKRADDSPSASSLDNGPTCARNSFTAETPVHTDEGQKPIEEIKEGDKVLADHPIYIENQGWLNAENLSVGDRLRRADGGMARVLAIERVELAGPEVVYNFTVKGPHTYFVLEVGVLVHNCGDDGQVTEAIPDLYDNLLIDESDLPKDWGLDDSSLLDDNFKFVDTRVTGIDPDTGGSAEGVFQRSHKRDEKSISFFAAFRKNPNKEGIGALPKWIDVGVSFPNKKGIPTVTYFTLRQMRMMEIKFGSLERASWVNVVNNRTLAHLQALQRKYSKAGLNNLIGQTHSVQYAETALTQSGHVIVPDSFEVSPGKPLPIADHRKDPDFVAWEDYYNKELGLPPAPPNVLVITKLTITAKLQGK